MKTISYKTPAMHCNHCVMHIKNALESLDGVEAVEADLANKEIEVEFNAPATDELIRVKLAEIGYPAELKD